MQPKNYVLLALAAGLVVGAGGWLLFAPKQAAAPGSTAATAPGGVQTQTTGSSTVTEINSQQAALKPPAIVQLSFSADLPAEARAALQSQYNTYAAQLKTAPTRVDLWLNLGIVYKIAGQYGAAVSVWTYVGKASPASVAAVAYGNLGDLYLNFLHDYPKAIASYQAAIKLNPGYADYEAGLKAAQAAH